jgi:hypothetical protein
LTHLRRKSKTKNQNASSYIPPCGTAEDRECREVKRFIGINFE